MANNVHRFVNFLLENANEQENKEEGIVGILLISLFGRSRFQILPIACDRVKL